MLLGMPAGVDVRFDPKAAITVESLMATTVFARAVASYVEQRAEQGQPVDVVHLFDAATALVAHAIRSTSQATPCPIVLTIRDLTSAGIGARSLLSEVDDSLLEADALNLDDEFCLLKAGLLSADTVIVPSESAIRQLRAGTVLPRLTAVISSLRAPLLAVASGVDYALVNPATNPSLLARYDAEDVRNKAANKTDWLRHSGLTLEPRPLVLVPGPMTSEFGAELLLSALDLLLEMDLSICVFESPSDDPVHGRAVASKFAGRATDAAVFELTHEDQCHRGFAAADFVLYPRRDGRGNLCHLAAQRYGAVVIADAGSTIGEHVVDADAGLVTGTGFLFNEPNATDLVGAVGRALTAYQSNHFDRLRRRGMRQDVSWDRPARRLLQLYQKCQRGSTSILP